MATATEDMDAEHQTALGRRYLIRFEEDTLASRPLWIRLIIEFVGTFILVTVAAGSGVINHYVGGGPISRTAAVIAPGAVVMAMIYAWGPLSGLHINPAVTTAFTARGVFPARWVVPYWAAQFAGAICAALFLQAMFTHVSAGGNYPIATPGGDWRSLVMEIVLTAILVSVILNTATGHRSIGHNAAIAVGGTVALLGLFASPISGASMNPARTLGPDIVSTDYTGWWIYILGPVLGALIAVAIIGAVRGLPDKQEREAAQGGALPMQDTPTPTAPQELADAITGAAAPGHPVPAGRGADRSGRPRACRGAGMRGGTHRDPRWRPGLVVAGIRGDRPWRPAPRRAAGRRRAGFRPGPAG